MTATPQRKRKRKSDMVNVSTVIMGVVWWYHTRTTTRRQCDTEKEGSLRANEQTNERADAATSYLSFLAVQKQTVECRWLVS